MEHLHDTLDYLNKEFGVSAYTVTYDGDKVQIELSLMESMWSTLMEENRG